MLSDSDSEGNFENVKLTINEHYAKAFQYKKEREELEKLKAKYGSDYEEEDAEDLSTDSESAESEDEDGEELTPAVDAAILRTLARIKRKDPDIYTQKDVFAEEQQKVSSVTLNKKKKEDKSQSKRITLRQAALEEVLEGSRSPSPEPLTHVAEQRALRDETISAFHTAVQDVEEDDDLLVPREKTKDELERDAEEYRSFLEREVGDLKELVTVDENLSNVEDEEDGKESKKKKKKKKGKKGEEVGDESGKKSKAEKDQDFLMNYILNRGWIDRSKQHIPTYNEITGRDKSKKKKSKAEADGSEHSGEDQPSGEDDANLSDASFESLASHFEASYNHRFEEPGAASIAAFPRNIGSTVRREENTRKEARERRKQRKEEEIQKRKEEVRRLKALKMREIRRKLDMIGMEGGLLKKGEGAEAGGVVDEALKELDLEGEWDPEKHDQQMAGLFDGEGEVEVEDDGEEWNDGAELDADGKPCWADDIDIGDIPMSDDDAYPVEGSSKKEKKKKKKKKKGGEEEEDFGVDIDKMDAEVEQDDEEWDGTEEMRKRKLDQYMEDIYKLEFNDMVGDLPTRFKYVPVEPQSFSLTPTEILMATDKELNEFMGIKKYAPYRQEKDRRWDKSRQEKLGEIKSTIQERMARKGMDWATEGGDSSKREAKPKKRKGKKERMKAKGVVGEPSEEKMDVDEEDATVRAAEPSEDKSKKRKRTKEDESPEVQADSTKYAEDGNGGEKKKKRRRHRKKEGEGVAAASES
ncbi:KRI1-like family C-terminal-domain-containing protein [Cyathus striatus]|nr:KRI1-like family C-terminal-domain-containing protein [Cyathus striatus]